MRRTRLRFLYLLRKMGQNIFHVGQEIYCYSFYACRSKAYVLVDGRRRNSFLYYRRNMNYMIHTVGNI